MILRLGGAALRRCETGRAAHLRGADDSHFIILPWQHNGALRLQVEMLLASHAYLPFQHHIALLPRRVHVTGIHPVPKPLRTQEGINSL